MTLFWVHLAWQLILMLSPHEHITHTTLLTTLDPNNANKLFRQEKGQISSCDDSKIAPHEAWLQACKFDH
jgi:hypothetical protein